METKAIKSTTPADDVEVDQNPEEEEKEEGEDREGEHDNESKRWFDQNMNLGIKDRDDITEYTKVSKKGRRDRRGKKK